MPVMDGYEATRRIKTQAGACAPAVIALTASVVEEERTVVLSIGCDDIVRISTAGSKPTLLAI